MVENKERNQVAEILKKIPDLHKEWNVNQLSQNQWNELYTERSELHKVKNELDRLLDIFLKEGAKERDSISDLIYGKIEVLLILQEILFMDGVIDTELDICLQLDKTYQLAQEHTFWNQQLARKRNMLRIAVLYYLNGDDKKSRRLYREACELPVIGNTIRNVYLFAKCYEQEAAFEMNLPAEGFQYQESHLPALLEYLSAFGRFLIPLLKDEEVYTPQEAKLLQELFTRMATMTSQAFEAQLKNKRPEVGIACLKCFADTADQASQEMQNTFKSSIWYIESTYAWALARTSQIDLADAFLKKHMSRPERVHMELDDHTQDTGLVAQISDMLYFAYYIVWAIRYPLAIEETRHFRSHLSNENLITARQIIDAAKGKTKK